MAKKAYRIVVLGKVQGVFYRASAKKAADRLGLFGTVRNQEDGTVLIEVEGEEEQLMEFIDWCKGGPEMAVVREIKLSELAISKTTTFDIIR